MTALPPALDRFGAELEIAVRRDLGVRRTRRRLVRAAVASAAAVAAAVGVLCVLPAGGPTAVERAAAALSTSESTILHYQLRGEQWNPDGSVVTWSSETWQLREAPYTRRQAEVGPDDLRAESLTSGDTNQLYDARANTIYVASRQELAAAEPRPRIRIVSRARLRELAPNARGHAFLVLKGKGYTIVATREGAERLREERARAEQAATAEEPFRVEILRLLESGRARETGRLEVAGRDAIRIEGPNGKQVYLVDATTYAPIEWTTSGEGGGVTLRFPVYEELPVDAESLALLDLEAQHPEARVVRDPAAYREAEARLFPRG